MDNFLRITVSIPIGIVGALLIPTNVCRLLVKDYLKVCINGPAATLVYLVMYASFLVLPIVVYFLLTALSKSFSGTGSTTNLGTKTKLVLLLLFSALAVYVIYALFRMLSSLGV